MDAVCVMCDAAPVATAGLYCADCQPTRPASPWFSRLGGYLVASCGPGSVWDLSERCWADACSRRGVTPAGLCEFHSVLLRKPV